MMFLVVLFAGCGAPGGGGGAGSLLPGSGGITGQTGSVKVALLLPISAPGSTSSVAKAIKQAAELALFDFDNPNVALIPKDTKGAGRRAARGQRNSRRRGAHHRPAIRARSCRRRADCQALGRAHDRLLQRREGRRQRRLSLELPGRPGRAAHCVVRYVARQTELRRARAAVGLWPHRRGRIRQSGRLWRRQRAGAGKLHRGQHVWRRAKVASALQSGQRIDALFCLQGARTCRRLRRCSVPASPARRSSSSVPGQWDYPNVGSERALVGGWYPAPDPRAGTGFKRYADTYGPTPPRIASLGYDAVSLAVSLSPE
ncbi:MAG: hypothetical protein R3D30_12075 [Hyphomicrobiales bacterium]